jgi:NNP family nitrate/nitrite transporter-like MFS transporter
MYYGHDHPAGKWSQRHRTLATAIAIQQGHEVHLDSSEKTDSKTDAKNLEAGVDVVAVDPEANYQVQSTVDVAVNESLTFQTAFKICISPLTWLPAFAYLTTFGLELAIDAQMATILFSLFSKRIHEFDQTTAGYYTSVFGFLNLVTRPFGGFAGDWVYRWSGTAGKKYWTLFCGLAMGASFLAAGLYLVNVDAPDLSTLMGIFSVAAIFSEFGNGANFALVPHCNAYNNGVMSGLVGAFGSLGGIVFALIFRFETETGKAIWIMGAMCIAINVVLAAIPVPEY